MAPRRADPYKKAFKYRFTELSPKPFSRMLSCIHLQNQLERLGFTDFCLKLVDHHAAHASAAAACSGFPEALVLTLDDVGDGLSGTLWTWTGGELTRLSALPARTTLGIFFEHVTNLMNMRELEDEGKVMALANFAYPIPDAENPMMGIIGTKGIEIVSTFTSTEMFRELKSILWRYPSKQFAYMAQRVLEKSAVSLADEALKSTGMKRMAVTGGGLLQYQDEHATRRPARSGAPFRLPPHGGLRSRYRGGARCQPDALRHNDMPPPRPLPRPGNRGTALLFFFGTNRRTVPVFPHPPSGVSRCISRAPLIISAEIILWFQGRMEIGPRALGHRSILARPDDRTIKDRLNLLLKKWVWYQPFCPSLLIEDAPALLETKGQNLQDNRFMTMGFRVRPERLPLMEGVINVDGTCRPQFVGNEEPGYRNLLLHLKKTLGYGVVLNTSFNLHGEPMVCAPGEAIEMLRRTGLRYIFMEDMLIENTHAEIR